MKKLLIIPFFFFTLSVFGQFTKPELYYGINQNIRLKSLTSLRVAAMLDSIVVSMSGSYTPQGTTLATVGGITSGTNLGTSPIALQDLLDDIFYPYVNPVFTSFSITGQSTTVEVGTTLSGSKTFTWGVTANSGVVSTIDLYNVTTAATLLAGTANDGTQAQTITTVQLNSNGATQVWRGIGHDTGTSPSDFNSSTFTVTSRFYRFYGADALPTNSATVRALPSSVFHTGATTFTFESGTSLSSFIVALPPSVTISSVSDLDALGADLTAQFVLTGTVNVLDAGSTNRAYNIYQYLADAPYNESHTIQVITAN